MVFMTIKLLIKFYNEEKFISVAGCTPKWLFRLFIKRHRGAGFTIHYASGHGLKLLDELDIGVLRNRLPGAAFYDQGLVLEFGHIQISDHFVVEGTFQDLEVSDHHLFSKRRKIGGKQHISPTGNHGVGRAGEGYVSIFIDGPVVVLCTFSKILFPEHITFQQPVFDVEKYAFSPGLIILEVEGDELGVCYSVYYFCGHGFYYGSYGKKWFTRRAQRFRGGRS